MNRSLSQPIQPASRRLAILLTILIFILATFVVIFRIGQAPDIFTDEIIYSRVSIRVTGERALVWDSGQPFIVHPPLYYLVAGAFLNATHFDSVPIYSPGDIYDFVFHLRYMNAIIAGLTAVLLFWFGKRLHSIKLGILLTALFILDPFGVRINRRAMLETLAMLLSLAGIAVFWIGVQSHRPRWLFLRLSPTTILSGLLLGAALLTKELTFINLLALFVFAVWDDYIQGHFRRALQSQRGGFFSIDRHQTLLMAGQAFLIAFLTYAVYMLWVMTEGNATLYFSEKILGIQRLLGMVQLTGWNRPGVSLIDLIVQRLRDYATSYLLLAMGGASLLWLLFYSFVNRAGRFLASWGMVLYPSFAFVALVGSGNDQFFYYLLIPALLLVSYSVITFPEAADYLFSQTMPKINPIFQPLHKIGLQSWKLAGIAMTVVIIALVMPYNLRLWAVNYALGQDNGYTQFAEYVSANLPAGTRINATGDPIKFRYFLPTYEIGTAATPEEAMQASVHYFALAPKDVQMRYGRIQPDLANWIRANGEQLFNSNGSSYGEIFLYRVDYTSNPEEISVPTTQKLVKGADFRPAESGFIDSLILWLSFWSLLWFGIALVIFRAASMIGREKIVNNESQQTDWI